MRNLSIYVIFGISLILIIFLFVTWHKKAGYVEERLTLPAASTKIVSVKQYKPSHTTPTVSDKQEKNLPSITKPTTNKPASYYAYSTSKSPTTTIYSTTATAAMSDTIKKISTTIATTTSGSNTEKKTSKKTSAPSESFTVKKISTVVPPAPEAVLKYVLFSVSYNPHINAGETQSLQLTMSPKSALEQLENVLLKDKTIQQNQMNAIEKIQEKYKYVSASLIAKNKCLSIEKKIPEEDKVYLHNINDSVADEVWQWDVTAPSTPTTNICNLSLFIRFCLNQNDCIPTNNPDKKIAIFIHITLTHKMYSWFTELGNLASSGIAIMTIVGLIGAYIWRRKKRAP